MKTENIIKILTSNKGVRRISEALSKPRFQSIVVGGLSCSAAPITFHAVAAKGGLTTAIFILNDEDEAGYFYNDLVQIRGADQTLFFPSSYRRAIKYNQKDTANEILRTDVISRLNEGGPLFIVTYPEAMAEKVRSKTELTENTLTLRVGERMDFNTLEQWMEEHGFMRTDYVYEPGQYAIRGSIFDVYSFASENPYRTDFFGDEVESIRTFDIQSQLSEDVLDSMHVVPDLNDEGSQFVPITDFLPDECVVVAKNFDFVFDRIQQICNEGFSQQARIEEESNAADDEYMVELDRSFKKIVVDPKSIRTAIDKFRKISFKPGRNDDERLPKDMAYVELDTSPQPLTHKNFQMLRDECHRLIEDGYKVVMLADNKTQIQRIREILASEDLQGRPLHHDDIDEMEMTLHEGFIFHDIRTAFFTDHQIFERYHKYSLRSEKARRGKVALTLKEIRQFEIGDYVVHIDHGVGRFAGLIRVPLDGVMQEMIKITYQNSDFIYVSIHSLHKVSKYKGREGEPPKVSRLGTGAWERMKGRVKAKVKDIARDLIKLYSERLQEQGFAFSQDSYLQHELEASFEFEDTPDQYKATQEVKQDMESRQPMDRLVCGDVGYGKTEVAIRAAFKAAADSKQVAVLVPTTVLAYQHYRTFTKRLADFPVKVEYLTRARNSKELKEILQKLKDGTIDIIIGTHKLVGKEVQFKDLGLLIIDEEQKFGVGVKERLRQLKVNVDTLTMTATPIPRTLQFSLMGARDLSVINTPPPNRYPIQTEIHTLTPQIIAEAVNFELSRNGQVFFVNNRIGNLEDLRQMIVKQVPDARVGIGHGRMDPKDMEKVILDFMNHEYDVLLSTTIIENGIDVPNANTIIINSAHTYGLSDLHQMRGRVGRSNKKAFCYLIAPPLASLPENSRRRLQAVENFSELGSGLNIAMQDLDIRGAGNMLGAEQSGFIADLGYETYQKVLAEAVSELKTTEFADVWADKEEGQDGEGDRKIDFKIDFVSECNIETDIPASFSEDYIPSSGERMALYREFDAINDDRELEAYRKRLIDRFGPIPPEGEELLNVMPLKKMACHLGICRLILKKKTMVCYLVENNDSPYYQSTTFGKILNFATTNFRRCQLIENVKRSIRIDNVPTIKDALNILNIMNS